MKRILIKSIPVWAAIGMMAALFFPWGTERIPQFGGTFFMDRHSMGIEHVLGQVIMALALVSIGVAIWRPKYLLPLLGLILGLGLVGVMLNLNAGLYPGIGLYVVLGEAMLTMLLIRFVLPRPDVARQ